MGATRSRVVTWRPNPARTTVKSSFACRFQTCWSACNGSGQIIKFTRVNTAGDTSPTGGHCASKPANRSYKLFGPGRTGLCQVCCHCRPDKSFRRVGTLDQLQTPVRFFTCSCKTDAGVLACWELRRTGGYVFHTRKCCRVDCGQCSTLQRSASVWLRL